MTGRAILTFSHTLSFAFLHSTGSPGIVLGKGDKEDGTGKSNKGMRMDYSASIQDLKKFENHAMRNSVTASNMRIILVEMAFPSVEVSVNISFSYFPLSYSNACQGDFQCSQRQAHLGEGVYAQIPICRVSL
jgi:hypothetical protein